MAIPRFATHSWAVRRALANRESFRTYGAFRAALGEPASRGRLPAEWWDVIRDHRGRIRYTVYSYVTPIAWVLDDDTVVVPQVRYSITTSGHQGLLYALNAEADSFPLDMPRRAWAPMRAPESWGWPLATECPADPTALPQEPMFPAAPMRAHGDDPVPPAAVVLARIQAALEAVASEPPPSLFFDGPDSLLDAPDLAYSAEWCGTASTG
ncbi:hypothetical protein [Yinghuangia soli]|uniref:DUF8033 domain-containing protein n=1 Tax=Yinghuangia soli TaxID=2908204 RepID=A0AA41Q433_9ACTN|nr:hypothetical protein [Yinghuangia soli]MCF2531175.1 hypothetical protein [Yinghuangia soli]